MLYKLVDSRLDIPPAPPRHVPRPRLRAALDTVKDVPLVLLSAGPGTGKTVLLGEWARSTRLRVAWLHPAPEDNDPARLCALVTAALRIPADPRPAGLVPGRPIDFVHALLEYVPPGPAPFVLAIDDAHVLTDPQVTELLDTLVRCGHPRLHLVLAARRDPPLPLHRYRLAGHLRELRAPELAMTREETRKLLAAHRVTLPASARNVLAARTEGWAAGVRLAAMRMEHTPAPATLVHELSFDHGGIGEYLMAEVLDRQPEPLRRVLVETSFLDEVTRPLAEAVTGLDGAGEMLAEFARDSSFVITLDAAATRFRYHRLFAEVLRYLLARDRKHERPELAARAAASFESAGDLEQALFWAAKAGDAHRAATVLVRGGLARAFTRHRPIPGTELCEILSPASRDLGAVPPGPEFRLAATVLRAATADAGTAARELALLPLDATTADQRRDGARQETRALAELMLGMRAGDAPAVHRAAARLTGPQTSDDLRGAVLLAQASSHFWHGAHKDVAALLGQALAAARQGGPVELAAEVLGMMVYVDGSLGRPRHADDAALQAHRLLREHPGLRAPLSLRLAAAVRSVQRADFAAAARHLRHAAPPVAVSADPGLAAACALWRATVLTHSGSPQEAKAVLEAVEGPPLPLLDVHRAVLLSGIETRLGRSEAALRRLEPYRDGRFAALADVACARSYLALDDVNGARQCIQRVLTSGTSRPSRDVLVEAMLLGARIAQLEHDTGRALEMITHALDVAQTALILPFAEAREAFGCLLARHPGIASRWPAAPGGTLGNDSARHPRAAPHHSVILTEREQSVLAYLATSLTAAEIAVELYLSVNTVKTHLAAIYRKLGASGRREAVRRARELELLLAVHPFRMRPVPAIPGILVHSYAWTRRRRS